MDEMDETHRDLVRAFTEFCTNMLGKVSDADAWVRGLVLHNKRIKVYQHMFRKQEFIVVFDFFKVSEEVRKQGTIIFPRGLPVGRRAKRAYFYRHGFDTKQYSI